MKELGEGSSSIDDVRAFWDARPCNIRHSQLEVGTKGYFDEVDKRRYFVEPHIPKFAEFKKYRGKKVLEVGCGIGTDAVSFAREGCVYTGTELSENSLKLAKKRFEVYGLQGNFHCLNAEYLSEKLGNQTFDLVYSFGVIHHSPSPHKIVSEIAKLMQGGAELKIMVYAKNSWKSAMIEAGLDQPEAQYGCPIAFSFTDNDIKDLLSDSFEIINITQDHIFPFNVEKYKNYEYEMLPWFQKMPTKMYRSLSKNFGWHKLVTARRI